MSSGKKLALNTAILSFCTVLSKGVMFIMVPLYTRWLSVDDYGRFDVFSTYVSLLIPVITLAVSNAVFRLSVDSVEDKSNQYIANGFWIVTLNLGIGTCAILLFAYLHKIQLAIPFLVLLVGEVYDNYFQGYLRAIKSLSLYGVCRTLTVVVMAISITVLIRFLNLGLLGLVYGNAIGYIFGVVFIIIHTQFLRRISGLRISTTRIKELVGYSWPLIPNDISWWVINVSDREIINLILGASANGIYAISNKVPSLCAAVFSVFNISWQENVIENMAQNKDEYYNKVLNVILRVLMSLCIGLVACNFIIFDFIFDSRYSSARLYTPFLILSLVFNVLSTFMGGIQISFKNTKANGVSTIIGAIINVVLHLSLVKLIGLYAASISTLLSNMCLFYIRKYMLREIYKPIVNRYFYLLILVYIYYSGASMMRLPFAINMINLLVAVCIVFFLNKSMLLRMWEVVYEKKRH